MQCSRRVLVTRILRCVASESYLHLRCWCAQTRVNGALATPSLHPRGMAHKQHKCKCKWLRDAELPLVTHASTPLNRHPVVRACVFKHVWW